jgi:5'-nucleotidase
MGLAEIDWLGSVACIEEDDYIFEDYTRCAKRWCKKFREQGCDLVIALTHMRMKNDKHLADEVQDLDLILGGHDHFYQ